MVLLNDLLILIIYSVSEFIKFSTNTKFLMLFIVVFIYYEKQEDEEESSDEWLRNLSESLLANGKMSILETISKCLSSGILDLVRACLTTIAWLSCGISLLPDSELQLFGFPTLISGLKEILEDDEQIEHQVLASMSLLNLSKNPGQ